MLDRYINQKRERSLENIFARPCQMPCGAVAERLRHRSYDKKDRSLVRASVLR